jgi:hypothetical protein
MSKHEPPGGSEPMGEQINGISLRDYFAGQALIAFQIGDEFAAWRRNQYEGGWGGDVYCTTTEPREIAKSCYLIADAMILVRSRTLR